MAYCRNCGVKLVEGAKFCQKCGASILASGYESQRQEEFVGKMYKCPHCGEILSSFVARCPACGFELRGAKATGSVRELALKLEAIEARREAKKSRSLKDRLYGEEITRTDEQKISLIRSFAIPNTKEDLYEFLILAESNIDIDLYDGTVLKIDARIAVSDAWKAKFEQAYQKAILIFADDSRLLEIKDLYNKTQKEIKKTKGKQWRLVGILWGVVIAIIAFVAIFLAIMDPIYEKKEVARLENIVDEIEVQLENGEYKYALMNADTLVYDGNMENEEQERQWKIKREYWIDKVIEEAEENGVTLERPADVSTDGTD